MHEARKPQREKGEIRGEKSESISDGWECQIVDGAILARSSQ
jgi:hypothetical protein